MNIIAAGSLLTFFVTDIFNLQSRSSFISNALLKNTNGVYISRVIAEEVIPFHVRPFNFDNLNNFIGINDFWNESIFFLEPLSTSHPPLWFLMLTPTLVILSIPFAYYLFVKNKNFTTQLANINKPLYEFLFNKWYFDEIYDILFVKTSKKFGLFLWKFFDIKVIDGFGPDGISELIKKFSVKANKFQSGYIYQYAFVMLVGFSAFLTFLIVK